jgi:hypothetical protein
MSRIWKEQLKRAQEVERHAKAPGARLELPRPRGDGASAARELRGGAMTFFYISDDLENDVRRCIQSWERQYPIAIRGLTVEGQVKHFTGTVQTIDHNSKRAIGGLWRVLIREINPVQKP